MFHKYPLCSAQKKTVFTRRSTVLFAILCNLLCSPGCTHKRKMLPPAKSIPILQPAKKQPPRIVAKSKKRYSNYTVTQRLNAFYRKWKNTPYRRGGMSQRGIDCSALIVVAYRDLFSLNLPRTTSEQARYGQRIPRSSMQPGDLIFFKTGFSQKHVAIFLKGQSFLHVSEIKGVIISRLDNYYWKGRFLEARRVL